jgi:hypothetical protein
MQKKFLEQFVQKYSLGGLVEAVRWKSTPDGLAANFMAECRDVVGFVSTTKIHLSDNDEFTLADTNPFRSMLNVMGDEVDMKVNYANKQPYSILFNDGTTKATLILSAPSSVKIPVPKGGFVPDLTITITKSFIETYGRAWSSMKDTDTVTFLCDGTIAQAVLGFDPDGTSSNIALTLTVAAPSPLDPVTFPSRNLKEVLNANKEMTEGTIAVSKQGVALVVCQLEHFNAEYYLFRINKG